MPVQLPGGGRLLRHRTAARGIVLFCLAIFHAGCASHIASVDPVRPERSRIQILNPVFAEHIEKIASQSPSFRAAWNMIRASGVHIRIGTYTQLKKDLPRWYRDHPTRWAGVTVTSSGVSDRVSSAVVVVRINPLEDIARRLPAGNSYVADQIDRVLIHEIYGHLAPVVASGDSRFECPDRVRRGESEPCVVTRERQVASELMTSRTTAGAAQ